MKFNNFFLMFAFVQLLTSAANEISFTFYHTKNICRKSKQKKKNHIKKINLKLKCLSLFDN